MTKPVAAVFAALFCTAALQLLGAGMPAAAATGPPGTWSHLSVSGPSPGARSQQMAVYDEQNDRMIVFGGAEGLSDTWQLTLGITPTWSQISATGPSGRKAATAIYDPQRHRMLVFGGYDGTYANDLWSLALEGTPAWTRLLPAGAPPSGRMFSAAIYDPLRDRMIVFGGHPDFLNDTWSLSLSGAPAWTPLAPSGTPPSPRYGHTAIYDPVGDRMIVFGGLPLNNEVWSLSLGVSPAWTQLTPTGTAPTARTYTTAVYDAPSARMVIHGGYPNSMSDAWGLSLDPPVWEQLPSNDLGRHVHSVVFHSTQDRMVIFGGLIGGNPTADVSVLAWGVAPPSVAGFSPAGGLVGDSVTVTGANLVPPLEVRFNGVAAPIVSSSYSVVRTQVPEGATTGPIEVTTSQGTATSAHSFFVGERPEVLAAEPESSQVGHTVVLLGRHFTGAIQVRFGSGGSAPFTADADSQITAQLDSTATTGPISVTTAAATGTSAFSFIVLPARARPLVTGIRDVPNDQGGRVIVRWLGSELDVAARPRLITAYRVWRRAPNVAASAAARVQFARALVEYWETVGEIPAAQLAGYAFTAATHQDSIAESNPYTAFTVQALTADPSVFYFAGIDSGYAVDNLAPAAPQPFTGAWLGGATALHWDPNREADFACYRLYRGNSEGFVPGPENLVTEKPDTGFVDVGAGGGFYKLFGVDVHGNISPFTLLTPSGTLNVGNSALPAEPVLEPIAPNPVRFDARLRFALPRASHATLVVFDVSGRRVCTLVDGLFPAGFHAVSWGEGDRTHSGAGPGIYVVRLEVEGRSLSRRLVLVR